jgi:hypothetical protein
MNKFSRVKKTLGSWFSRPWYPIAFSAYPVLALLAFNIGQIKFEAGWRILVFSVGLAGIIFVLLRLVLHNWYRAAFLSMLWMALFFSYGHLYIYLLDKWEGVNFKPWLLIGWLVLALLSVLWATRPKVSFVGSVLPINVIALGLVVTSLVQISSGVQKGGVHSLGAENAPVQELTRPQDPPDIYYFILDMYARQDLLKSAYGYDNSNFVRALESRGFYVAQCSQSNYTRTELSLGSSLNLSYLPELDPKFSDPKSIGRSRLWSALKYNTVRYQLEEMGYKTVSFANGFPWSEMDDMDVFFTPPPFASGMTEFETLFLETTLARNLQDFGWLDLDQINGQNFRDRHMLVFNSMKDVARMQAPKFVYVHLILPHPPFVFGPNGEHTDPADFWNEQKDYSINKFKMGYTNQTTFLNSKLLETLDTILSKSKTPPIIILQGDHGPWIQPNPQHFFILNAYYLPGHGDELYPSISPVNSFRFIFNNYFGGKYDMLDDVSYYSPVPKLYNFSQVPYPCK